MHISLGLVELERSGAGKTHEVGGFGSHAILDMKVNVFHQLYDPVEGVRKIKQVLSVVSAREKTST